MHDKARCLQADGISLHLPAGCKTSLLGPVIAPEIDPIGGYALRSKSARTARPVQTTLLGLLFLVVFVIPSNADIRTVEGFVQKVSDGDTVTLITRDGTKLRVRLYGIDAPEVRHEKKPGQPFGEEAKGALAGKVLRKEVTITIQDRDQYKRVVGIIRIGNRNINEEMVREGWAWAYREYLRGPYVSEFIGAEREAREKKLGLWRESNPRAPWEFKRIYK